MIPDAKTIMEFAVPDVKVGKNQRSYADHGFTVLMRGAKTYPDDFGRYVMSFLEDRLQRAVSSKRHFNGKITSPKSFPSVIAHTRRITPVMLKFFEYLDRALPKNTQV